MDREVHITLLTNAGLLLEYEGSSFLVDGLFNSGNLPFQNLPESVWSDLLAGKHPFEQIDYLLFTHDHPDHFSEEMTWQYLRHHRVKGVFLPKEVLSRSERLKYLLQQEGIPTALLSPQSNKTLYHVTPQITVQAIETLHLDKQYWDVPHFCYLLTFGKKQLLVTADVDYTQEQFTWLQDRHIYMAFVNPLFFHELHTCRHFCRTLNTDTLCIYHIPPEQDSPINRMLRRDLQKDESYGREVIQLSRLLQQVRFKD